MSDNEQPIDGESSEVWPPPPQATSDTPTTTPATASNWRRLRVALGWTVVGVALYVGFGGNSNSPAIVGFANDPFHATLWVVGLFLFVKWLVR